MTDPIRARRATVYIGSIEVDGFQLPDGTYRMSLTQTAESVGLGIQNASDFLRSNAFKSLLGESYTPQIFTLEIESEPGKRGQSRFRALTLELVCAYWLWQAYRGNKTALSLCMALLVESLERRFDFAFELTRSEPEYNEQLQERIQRLERNLKILGEAYASDDIAREQRDYFERRLREHGIDPWGVPTEEESQ